MTYKSIITLFGAMFVLAIIPSPSVFSVVARSIASGFIQGSLTVIGIIIGDFIFILLAIYGLSMLAENLEGLFILVKYLGSFYLIGLGIVLWRSRIKLETIETINNSSWFTSFMSGLLITLSDQKAILFYIGFFPAFLDLSNFSIVDTGLVLAIAAAAIGGAKLGYAYLADKSRSLLQSTRAKKFMNILAGIIMIVTGVFVLIKT